MPRVNDNFISAALPGCLLIAAGVSIHNVVTLNIDGCPVLEILIALLSCRPAGVGLNAFWPLCLLDYLRREKRI